MPVADRSLDIVAFISDHFRDIVRRRLSELAGVSLLTLALIGAIALATWSVQDPSLSHATEKPIHNLLGYPGAIFSDLAMQLLGLAAVMLLLPAALTGWRLLAHRPVGEKWRGVIWLPVILFAAAFASTLPRPGSWPLPTGLGGVFGDALLQVPALMTGGSLNGFMLVLVAIIMALSTFAAQTLAANWNWPRSSADKPLARSADDDEIAEDEDEDDHVSAWRGMIAHALLSWKARAWRMLRGVPRKAMRGAISSALSGARPSAAGARQEPRFDDLGRVAAPSLADDTPDEEEEDAQPAPRRRVTSRPPRRSNGGYTLPSLNLLAAPRASDRATLPKDVIDANGTALESVLGDFGVRGEIINARPGPVVTLYELEPAPGIKS
ncbi:MAG: DNA translocase FtsK 4TM domain-containing protein, partial [Terriglobales bacterium]